MAPPLIGRGPAQRSNRGQALIYTICAFFQVFWHANLSS
jgi:hypothetical protein